MIIAVDYDGTLEKNGRMNRSLINKLRQRQAAGDIIILWTCRERERLMLAVRNLKNCGLIPEKINDNAESVIRQLKSNPRKIVADIYIDDIGGAI